jgi:hypothetical protein
LWRWKAGIASLDGVFGVDKSSYTSKSVMYTVQSTS